jgi:hypothetical protein
MPQIAEQDRGWGGRIRTSDRLIQSQVIEHASGIEDPLAILMISTGSGAAVPPGSDDHFTSAT